MTSVETRIKTVEYPECQSMPSFTYNFHYKLSEIVTATQKLKFIAPTSSITLSAWYQGTPEQWLEVETVRLGDVGKAALFLFSCSIISIQANSQVTIQLVLKFCPCLLEFS